MVPVTLADDLNRECREVYLVASRADIQRIEHLEPAHVVFVEASVREPR